MHVYAIGDLHLSFSSDKPMDVFGPAWRNHAARLEDAWRARVSEEDLVLIPGDISWAMQLKGASPDLAFIGRLPGKKLLLRGNHDYWWSSLTQVRAALPEGTYALQNDAFCCGGLCVAGSRGWSCPGGSGFTLTDEKIYQRELQRLELSLARVPPGRRTVVMLHFPPFNERRQASGFTRLIEDSGAELAVYAHLHGAAQKNAFEGTLNGVRYLLVAADHLDFTPRLLLEDV